MEKTFLHKETRLFCSSPVPIGKNIRMGFDDVREVTQKACPCDK